MSKEELAAIIAGYSLIKNEESAQAYREKMIAKDPESPQAINKRAEEILAIEDPDEQLAAYEEFAKKYPNNSALSNLEYRLFYPPIRAGEFEKVDEMLAKIDVTPNPMLYNSVAWSMYEADGDLDLAKKYAVEGIVKIRAEIEKPGERKPEYVTAVQYKGMQEGSLAYLLDTYAAILEKLGQEKEALDAITEAVVLEKRDNSSFNERYVKLLVNQGEFETAFKEMEKFIIEGTSTEEMPELLETAYNALPDNEEEFEVYYEKLLEEASKNLRAKLKNEMYSEPAPEFTLTDLEGNEVSLSDLKGKTLILDFWATWCGPCKASFPAMQKAVDKYADNDNVEFLFINTWERVPDKKENASNFISENNYSFHVLLDTENEVVSKYKVQGIPTKFLVDKEGNIRFEAVGWSGNADKMLEEIDMMIELVN